MQIFLTVNLSHRNEFLSEFSDTLLLTISSERKDKNEEKDSGGNHTRREFSYQLFQRSFSLPQNKVLGDKISVKYTDGIFYIIVPKSEEAKVKPAKQIAVAVS